MLHLTANNEALVYSLEKNNVALVSTFEKSLMENGRQEKGTVITKPKAPPFWNDESFERYKEQVEHWNENSRDSELNNYFDLVEVLKKKNDLKGYIMNNVLDRIQLEGHLVEKILEVLGYKFIQTYAERIQAMLEKLKKLQKLEESENDE